MKNKFKKMFAAFSCVLLAAGAGAVLKDATNGTGFNNASAASNTFIIIGDHQTNGWNNTDDNFAMSLVNDQYEFKNIHWVTGNNWRITWAGEWGQYAGWSTLQDKTGMEAGSADNNIKATRDWYYDVYFKNTDGNKIYLASAAYTVTLNKDGGTVVSGDDLTGYSYGENKTLPTLSKEGYTFDGFFEDDQFSGDVVTAISATDHGNKTYFAKFTKLKDTYTVAFNANGGQGEMDPITGEVGKTIIAPQSTFVAPEGKTFAEWNTKTDGSGDAYKSGAEIPSQEKDSTLTLYATWREVGETAYYLTNNLKWDNVYAYVYGSSQETSKWPGDECEFAYINELDQNVYKIVVPDDISGLVFNNGNDQQTQDISGSALEEHNAYFVKEGTSPYEVGGWDVTSVQVTYNFNGGKGDPVAPTSAYVNAKGIEVNDGKGLATEDGKVFDKWNTSADGKGESSYIGEDGKTYIDTIGVTEDKTLYAQYKEPTHEDGSYIVGSMTDEKVVDEYKLEEHLEVPGEYKIELDLDVNDTFKIVNYAGGIRTDYGFESLEGGQKSAKEAGQIDKSAVAENSPMLVKTAGHYTVYFKTQNDPHTIWIGAIEVEHDYSLTVTHSDTTTEDVKLIPNVDSEFMTEKDVEVVAGDTLAFFIDGKLQTVNPKTIGNNNCHSEDGVLTVTVNMNAKIYVDFVAGTCFCGGLEVNKYYMTVDNNVVSLAYNATPDDPSFNEWYVEGVSFSKGAVIRFVDTLDTYNNATQFDVLKLNDSSKEGLDVVDNKLVCVADDGVSGNVYLKLKNGEDEIYFGNISQALAQAIDYADIFNAKLAHVCKADNTTDLNALEAAWEDCENGYGLMIEATQNILKSATAEHSNESIREFAKKYDYVFAKYSAALKLNNFAERNVSFNQDAYAIGLTASENANFSLVAIIVISVLATSVAALAIVNRKKRAK